MPKGKHIFSGIHIWIATLGAIFAMVFTVWTTVLSDRALLVTSDYHVEDAELEGFQKIFKRLVFSIKLRNEGDGPIVLKELHLAHSIYDHSMDFDKMSKREQYNNFVKYWNCTKHSGVLPKDWVPAKKIAEIEPGQFHSMKVDYDAIESTMLTDFGLDNSKFPGTPICLVARIQDQFGMNHSITMSIGEIKTGEGVQHESGANLMNYKIKYRDHFYLLPKSKCIQMFSHIHCISL